VIFLEDFPSFSVEVDELLLIGFHDLSSSRDASKFVNSVRNSKKESPESRGSVFAVFGFG